MCARGTYVDPHGCVFRPFSIPTSSYRIAKDLLEPRYNVSVGQKLIVRGLRKDGTLGLSAMTWGLIPYWSDDASIAGKTFNARAESVHTRRAFREAFERRRCLVLLDGFYEWPLPKRRGSRPGYYRLNGGKPIALAGLWERNRHVAREPVLTCTIITTDANALLRGLPHDRMPVILPDDAIEQYLRGTPNEARDVLKPYEGGDLETWRVSSYVNSVGNEGPRCIEKLDTNGERRGEMR